MKISTKERREFESFLKENKLVVSEKKPSRKEMKQIALTILKIGSGSFWGGTFESSESYLVKHPIMDNKYGVIRINWVDAFNFINTLVPKWDAKKGYYLETLSGVQVKVCVR